MIYLIACACGKWLTQGPDLAAMGKAACGHQRTCTSPLTLTSVPFDPVVRLVNSDYVESRT